MSQKIELFESVSAYVRSFSKPDRSAYTKEYRKKVGERYAVLAKMERQVKAHIGQLVLVVSRYMADHGCSMGMPSRRQFARREEQFRLGIIAAPAFVMRKSPEFLPWNTAITTDGHVAHGSLVPGPIADGVLAGSFLLELDKPLRGDVFSVRERTALQVVCGDKAVHAWAVAEQQEEQIQAMASLLDRELVFPTLVERRRRERDMLARRIEGEWVTSSVLARRVRAVVQAGQAGAGVISTDGISLTLCENADDAFWISLGDREKLQRSDGDVVRTLRRLIELGVDETMPNIHLVRHIAQHFRIAV